MTRRSAIVVVSLVIAALVGVALMTVPSSPLHRKPTLGLDLQGGLEITKQAVPPKGRELTKEDLSRSVSIMRDRVDRLGVSEPEIRTQGKDQITIALPGVKDPAAAAKIIGKTAQLELYDLEANLVPAVDRCEPLPGREGVVYDLLAGQQALRRRERRAVLALRHEEEARRRPGPTKTVALAKYGGKMPDGTSSSPCPGHRRRLVPRTTCARARDVAHAAVVPAELRPAEGAGDDGRRPQAERYPAGLRPAIEPADRDDAVHGRGREEVRRDHAARGATRRKLLYNTLYQSQGLAPSEWWCLRA